VAKKKRWAVAIRVGNKIKVIEGPTGGIGWVSSKREAQQKARWVGGKVVDAELLANPKTRKQALKAAGL
jgi:hypothetical protein